MHSLLFLLCRFVMVGMKMNDWEVLGMFLNFFECLRMCGNQGEFTYMLQ